ncbi:hypothetical protein [Streptomyces sp. TLI_171]|uniref:hypothetical protein n=1 Tax=Streptomyces sp. TLI_171 TaxID=1938859 RepID=UPI000C4E0277|nr:hypothetical protein [Streptomyces sp. TLI_171]RKE23433.1 hypothetical protein BX266_6901 [Streptomyces sp. TLI_171]
MIDTRPAATSCSSVSVGGWLPYPDPVPHPALGGRPVTHVAGPLWLGLRAMLLGLDPAAAEHDPTAGACDVLRLLALAARPAPAGGYLTDPVADLGHRPVRLRPDGAGGLLADQP